MTFGFNQRPKSTRRRLQLAWELEEARRDYAWGLNMPAYTRLMYVMDEVIVEPPLDSEEYKDGERKSATPDDEQQEEEDAEEVAEQEVYHYRGLKPERDEDGYLIR